MSHCTGITIKGGRDVNDRDLGVFVKDVTEGSAAEAEDIRSNDRIIAINEVDVRELSNDRSVFTL